MKKHIKKKDKVREEMKKHIKKKDMEERTKKHIKRKDREDERMKKHIKKKDKEKRRKEKKTKPSNLFLTCCSCSRPAPVTLLVEMLWWVIF